MLSVIASFISGLFNSSKATDMALDAIKKLGGLDEMTGKEKSDYLLAYLAATKHQSESRRFIALLVCGVWVLLLMVWVIASGVGTIGEFSNVMLYAADIKLVLLDLVNTPFTVVLSFYFVMNVAQKFGGK